MRILDLLILNADVNIKFRNLVGIGLVRTYHYSFSVLHKIIDFFSHFIVRFLSPAVQTSLIINHKPL